MENMKRFAFLITDGEVILVNPVWHETELEAKNHLQKSLSPIYSIIEDVKIISEFIEKEEQEMTASPDHSKLLEEYRNDLNQIKKSLKTKEEVKMNKEKLAQLLAEALEKNCYFNIHFSQYQGNDNAPVRKEEAQELIDRFAEALGECEVKNTIDSQGVDDYKIDVNKFRVVCSYKPGEDEKIERKRKQIEQLKKELSYLEEDVDLSGGVDHAV